MYGIEILLEEHKNILKFVNFTREECKKILQDFFRILRKRKDLKNG